MNRKAIQQRESRIEPDKQIRYARLPWNILTERTLPSDAKIVYAAIAGHAFQGNVAYVGQRRISLLTGFSQPKVSRLLKALSTHVEVRKDGPGRRSFYVLNSPVFGQKQGKEDVIISSPSGGKRLASVAKTA